MHSKGPPRWKNEGRGRERTDFSHEMPGVILRTGRGEKKGMKVSISGREKGGTKDKPDVLTGNSGERGCFRMEEEPQPFQGRGLRRNSKRVGAPLCEGDIIATPGKKTVG